MGVIYFDIGDTLARAEVSNGKLQLHPLPGAIDALEALSKHRKGIISYPGDGLAAKAQALAALQTAFGKYFDEPALLHWGRKDSTAIFKQAIIASGGAAHECLFVGENAAERRLAEAAGMRTAATPQQATKDTQL
jgi:FMN phosphatase YigB (HAD superfamily)